MKGLWHVSTRTIDPGLGITIYDALIAAGVIFFLGLLIVRKSGEWPEAWLLITGMVFLSMWFTFHWIDVVVHHSNASVKYNYILFDTFNRSYKAFSDVLVLWGTWKVLFRFRHLRPEREGRETGTVITTMIAILLWVLTFSQICLLFALCFAWLCFADLDIINAIAGARSAFEVAFTAVQFCATFATLPWILDRMQLRRNEYYQQEKELMLPAYVALLLRSFCEVVIVGQLNRDPSHLQTIAGARDVTYGLFSLCFAVFVSFAVPKKGRDDPIIEDQKVAVRKVKNLVISRLDQVTDQDRKSAPPISVLFDQLEKPLRKQKDQGLEGMLQMAEIKRLRKVYAEWKPIYKWQGTTSEDPENMRISAGEEEGADVAL